MVSVRGLALQPGPVSDSCGGVPSQLALSVTLNPRAQAIHCAKATEAGTPCRSESKDLRPTAGWIISVNASGRNGSR